MYLDIDYLKEKLAECEWQLKLLEALRICIEEEEA